MEPKTANHCKPPRRAPQRTNSSVKIQRMTPFLSPAGVCPFPFCPLGPSRQVSLTITFRGPPMSRFCSAMRRDGRILTLAGAGHSGQRGSSSRHGFFPKECPSVRIGIGYRSEKVQANKWKGRSKGRSHGWPPTALESASWQAHPQLWGVEESTGGRSLGGWPGRSNMEGVGNLEEVPANVMS